ncbi:MAG: sodium-dependent bicarbonate transport family permease [Phycisphaerales bacterium]|jgi:hypothetical protein|nr:sodium-dependent bicarbonate transport family permease [Phycisphaerales bacterium]
MIETDLVISNLLSPPVLFFSLGILAALARSDLEVPESIGKLFSLYLLWAIGFKGGVELNVAGFDPRVFVQLGLGVLLSAGTAFTVFRFVRKRLGIDNATAVAASYGSVSVVTFITGSNFLERQGIPYGGHLVALLALMESPAILVAIWVHRHATREASEADGERVSHGHMLREALFNGPVFLLLGSLVAGILTGERGFAPLKPFCNDIFQGVLVLFLLEGGLRAGRRLGELREIGGTAIRLALTLPPASAFVSLVLARIVGMGLGDTVLFMLLAASASYIAVPAAMRTAVPKANPAVYVPMALTLTFPLNISIGIPLYTLAARLAGAK